MVNTRHELRMKLSTTCLALLKCNEKMSSFQADISSVQHETDSELCTAFLCKWALCPHKIRHALRPWTWTWAWA